MKASSRGAARTGLVEPVVPDLDTVRWQRRPPGAPRSTQRAWCPQGRHGGGLHAYLTRGDACVARSLEDDPLDPERIANDNIQ
jgi:hypothetical protein